MCTFAPSRNCSIIPSSDSTVQAPDFVPEVPAVCELRNIHCSFMAERGCDAQNRSTQRMHLYTQAVESYAVMKGFLQNIWSQVAWRTKTKCEFHSLGFLRFPPLGWLCLLGTLLVYSQSAHGWPMGCFLFAPEIHHVCLQKITDISVRKCDMGVCCAECTPEKASSSIS